MGISNTSIDQSLIGWWCPSLDPSPGGNVLSDLSGSGNDANLLLSPVWEEDTSNGGVRSIFYNNGPYAEMPTEGMIPESFTMSTWVRTRLFNLPRTAIIGSDGSVGTRGWQLRYSFGKLEYFSTPDGGTRNFHRYQVLENRSISDDQWHHVGIVFNNGVVSIWQDGVSMELVDSGVGDPIGQVNFRPVSRIAESVGGLIAPSIIRVDDTRLYSRALATEEMEHLSLHRGIQ